MRGDAELTDRRRGMWVYITDDTGTVSSIVWACDFVRVYRIDRDRGGFSD